MSADHAWPRAGVGCVFPLTRGRRVLELLPVAAVDVAGVVGVIASASYGFGGVSSRASAARAAKIELSPRWTQPDHPHWLPQGGVPRLRSVSALKDYSEGDPGTLGMPWSCDSPRPENAPGESADLHPSSGRSDASRRLERTWAGTHNPLSRSRASTPRASPASSPHKDVVAVLRGETRDGRRTDVHDDAVM